MVNDIKKIGELARPIIEKNGKILYDIKEVNDYGINIVEITIDDPNSLDIDIDDVAKINEEILDEVNDLLPDGYYLEVSSVGIERELKTENDYRLAIGKYIYVSLYEKNNDVNEKEIYGDLKSYDDDKIIVETKIKTRSKEVTIEKNKIAKIRLAVKF